MNASQDTLDLGQAANLNALWSALAFEEWRRLGLVSAIVCPGSRSAPLACAVSRLCGVDRIIAHDERAAAFVALGAARATGLPAVVVTTSGTAVANLLPGVVEAAQTGTPMILVTADRPPELRDCGANQSIHQRGIFGEFSRWFLEIPCAGEVPSPAFLLSSVNEAWQRSIGRCGPSGPVHLNWMFREPLAPTIEPWDRAILGRINGWLDSSDPWRIAIEEHGRGDDALRHVLEAVAERAGDSRRNLVVVGACHTKEQRAMAKAIASSCACPVIADIGSGLRSDGSVATRVAHGDLIASSDLPSALRPDFILRIGGNISSRRVGELLRHARSMARGVAVIRDGALRADPDHTASAEILVDARAFVGDLRVTDPARGTVLRCDEQFLGAWVEADRVVEQTISAMALDGDGLIDEPTVARIVAEAAPEGTTLVLGNSMAIRDADSYVGPNAPRATVAVSRGASGIDGLVATAVGHARATHRPAILLIGDLSLLHDLGSLALVRHSPFPVVIVVVNNDGGGIFHFLPVGEHPTVLEPWTTGPHGLDFASAAAMFALHYRAIGPRGTAASFARTVAEAVEMALDTGESVMIEVHSDRTTNVEVHREIQRETVAAVERALCETAPRARVESAL